MRVQGLWMSLVECINKFIERGRDVREGNPRVFRVGLTFPVHKVVIMMTNFLGIKDGVDGQCRAIGRCEWFWRCVRLEWGGGHCRAQGEKPGRLGVGEIGRRQD